MIHQHEFIETNLNTKFADFNLRIYKDLSGKENLVFWTKNLNIHQPVLVRVHSECITGDLFGSLHCDCGKQLSKSLQKISTEGGVLIYLRQEGRGIGLFEKIKSYNLQSQGYDTFEANVILGHKPDARSYELVKDILDDLGIYQIRLLTNNPSKVSDIAKYGVKIVERIPIISKPNKHNKLYLETKRNKFQHIINKKDANYIYQFQLGSLTDINFLSSIDEKICKDPLLKVGVGIAANNFTFTNKSDIKRINKIVTNCSVFGHLVPILHFSFKYSKNATTDFINLVKLFPSVGRIQLNDLEEINIGQLKYFSNQVTVDLPLSSENFDLIHNQKIREIVRKNNVCIVLDNSKGKGKKEITKKFIRKIDILLSYGINNIMLCGGFGPSQLDQYFYLRRYYRINFSIDAESNLKTNDITDEKKVLDYLRHLIRFDDPKELAISQTKKFMKKIDQKNIEKIKLLNNEFLILPKVFHSGQFPSTSWFAKSLEKLVKDGEEFCEVGCGSGIVSCHLALKKPHIKIVATDINPNATENTKQNATNHGIGTRISTYCGDVLDGIDSDKRFDTIFWALPFGFLDPGTSVSMQDKQVFDPGYVSTRKFIQTANRYLKKCGKLYLGFSSELGHYKLLESLAKDSHAEVRLVDKTKMKETQECQFEILELTYNE